MMNAPEHQRGAALLIVLIALVFMTLAAVRLSGQTVLSLNRAEPALIRPKLRWMLFSVENASLMGMNKLLEQPYNAVSFSQEWAQPVLLHFEQGEARSRIISGESCLNINIMGIFPEHDDGKTPARNAIFQALSYSGLSSRQADTVIKHYSAYLRKNKDTPLLDIYALKLSENMAHWHPSGAAKLLCARPDTRTLIAVNLLRPADARLLNVLSQNQMSVDQARRFIEGRPTGGWRTNEEVRQALDTLPGNKKNVAENLINFLSVEGQNFIIESEAAVAEQRMILRSYLYVDKKNKHSKIWKRQLISME